MTTRITIACDICGAIGSDGENSELLVHQIRQKLMLIGWRYRSNPYKTTYTEVGKKVYDLCPDCAKSNKVERLARNSNNGVKEKLKRGYTAQEVIASSRMEKKQAMIELRKHGERVMCEVCTTYDACEVHRNVLKCARCLNPELQKQAVEDFIKSDHALSDCNTETKSQAETRRKNEGVSKKRRVA